MNKLTEWLRNNKIKHAVIDKECVLIDGVGKMFYQNMTKIKSIFKSTETGEMEFNLVEDREALEAEDIHYVIFKFGDNYYYHNFNSEFSLNILKYIGERVSTEIDIPYVNLGVHTPYELLNGSFMPKQWVTKAKYLGHAALGVCDLNTMASLFVLQKECASANINPVFGYSLVFTDDEDNKVAAKVYVQTQKGLRNLLRIQKTIMVDNPDDKTLTIDQLLSYAEGNVLVFGKNTAEWISGHMDLIDTEFIDKFIHVLYQVDLSEYKAERIDIVTLTATKHYFDNVYNSGLVPPVLIGDCYYLDKDDARNKIILNKIAIGAAHQQSEDQYFKDIDEHYAYFLQLFDADKWDVLGIFRECCANTIVIADGAKARWETSRNYMPKYDMTEEEAAKYKTTHNMFNQLLEEGLQRLVPASEIDKYRKQMEYEKYIIESTDNIDYLLVQYDTVNWCKRNGILVGCGRGSAAGSLLLYLLGITLVDPMKYDLIFERFLLPERAGLYPANTTVVCGKKQAIESVNVTLDNNHILSLDVNAELVVKREGEDEPIEVYADELQRGDYILFDNKDKLFTINEINEI
jgi:DNA polymerase-3 subunit alpha